MNKPMNAPDGAKGSNNGGKTINLGHAFGMAFCAHFGLPSNQVLTATPHAARDEIMHAKVEIALTPDDLAGIAMRMGAAGVNPSDPSGPVIPCLPDDGELATCPSGATNNVHATGVKELSNG